MIKVADEYRYIDPPLKMKDKMREYALTINKKKSTLFSKIVYDSIKTLSKGYLMLESLDKNIFNSLKNAFIFQNNRQLKSISTFLLKN